jgi:hypothetical protein
MNKKKKISDSTLLRKKSGIKYYTYIVIPIIFIMLDKKE